MLQDKPTIFYVFSQKGKFWAGTAAAKSLKRQKEYLSKAESSPSQDESRFWYSAWESERRYWMKLIDFINDN
jgi:hypothetical protein